MNTTTAALTIYADGREVCRNTPDGKMLYDMRRYVAWVTQGHLCAICSRFLRYRDAVTDHIIPRGHGGGTRDDRQANLRATCWSCNDEKGSRRGW